RSYTAMTPAWRLSSPYASDAAVGSLMMRSTSRPAILPASRVAWRWESLKYAGTVMMASVIGSPRSSSANERISISTNAEISSGEYSRSRIFTLMSPFDAATIWYGRTCFALATSSLSYLRPMRRLMAKTVLNGLVMACRLAICPTRRSPSSVKPTTEGVVRLPSRFEITCGVVTSTTATQEFVVPRSMPRILAIAGVLLLRPSHRHLHHRRPQQTIVQEVALLQHGRDRVVRHVGVLLRHHRLVEVRVEARARLLHHAQAVTAQHVEELLVDEGHAFVEVVSLLGVLERAVEVVEDRQEVLDHAGHGVFEVVLLLALRALAEVRDVGQRAEVAVLELAEVLLHRGGRGLRLGGRPSVGGRLRGLIHLALDLLDRRRRLLEHV